MKLFKKIGIGCLALVICFCSCFKFVNAETIDILDEPFKLVNGSYELFIDESYVADSQTVIATYNQNSIFVEISYLGNGSNIIQFDGSVAFDVNATYQRDFVNIFTGITYQVYSFNINSDSEILKTIEFSYDDYLINYLSFVETNIETESFSVYDTIYNLIETFIFGGSIEVGSYQDLTATILSSIICVLVFALPFLIIWKVIKVIMG